MRAFTKFLAGGAAIAALASAAPAAAQYYPGYSSPGYGYGNPYGGNVGQGYGGYGAYGMDSQQVVNVCVSAIQARLGGGYGYNQSPDLTWKCSVDFRGRIVGLDVDRAQSNYGYGNGYSPYNNYDYSQYGYRRY